MPSPMPEQVAAARPPAPRRTARTVLGAALATAGGLPFLVLTVSLSMDIRIDGPMNLWPPALWLVLLVDGLFALLVLAGVRLMRPSDLVAGVAALAAGVLMLGLVAHNQLQAPPREGRNDTGLAPADLASYLSAYAIAAAVLGLGVWLVGRHRRQRRSHGAGPQA